MNSKKNQVKANIGRAVLLLGMFGADNEILEIIKHHQKQKCHDRVGKFMFWLANTFGDILAINFPTNGRIPHEIQIVPANVRLYFTDRKGLPFFEVQTGYMSQTVTGNYIPELEDENDASDYYRVMYNTFLVCLDNGIDMSGILGKLMYEWSKNGVSPIKIDATNTLATVPPIEADADLKEDEDVVLDSSGVEETSAQVFYDRHRASEIEREKAKSADELIADEMEKITAPLADITQKGNTTSGDAGVTAPNTVTGNKSTIRPELADIKDLSLRDFKDPYDQAPEPEVTEDRKTVNEYLQEEKEKPPVIDTARFNDVLDHIEQSLKRNPLFSILALTDTLPDFRKNENIMLTGLVTNDFRGTMAISYITRPGPVYDNIATDPNFDSFVDAQLKEMAMVGWFDELKQGVVPQERMVQSQWVRISKADLIVTQLFTHYFGSMMTGKYTATADQLNHRDQVFKTYTGYDFTDNNSVRKSAKADNILAGVPQGLVIQHEADKSITITLRLDVDNGHNNAKVVMMKIKDDQVDMAVSQWVKEDGTLAAMSNFTFAGYRDWEQLVTSTNNLLLAMKNMQDGQV